MNPTVDGMSWSRRWHSLHRRLLIQAATRLLFLPPDPAAWTAEDAIIFNEAKRYSLFARRALDRCDAAGRQEMANLDLTRPRAQA